MPPVFSTGGSSSYQPGEFIRRVFSKLRWSMATGFGLFGASHPQLWTAGSAKQHAAGLVTRLMQLLRVSLSTLIAIYIRLFRRFGDLLHWLLEWLDYLLIPRTLFKIIRRHALAVVVLFCVNVIYRLFFADAVSRTKRWIYVKLLDPVSRQQHEELSKRIENTNSYAEWREIARTLDSLEGLDSWRRDMTSSEYDYKRIAAHLWRLRRLYDKGDIRALMWFLRSSVSRSMVGITTHSLYDVLRTGTKELIEDYLGELSRALQLVCESEEIPLDERFNFFNEMRHSYGRSALMLSGGATLGLYHTGVVKALYESQLLPKILSGSSVGSIIAAMICTRTDNEVRELLSGEPGSINLSFFKKNESTFSRCMKKLWKDGHMMDIAVLSRAVRANVPDLTFQEAHERTGRVLNIAVTPAASHGNMENTRVLNYLTAPNVLIWSACLASCAIPYVYEAVELLARNEKGDVVLYLDQDPVKWEDGSFSFDLPKERLAELFNVNHFIVSQVNPHVVPFLTFMPDPHISARPRYPIIEYLKRPISKTLQYLSLELRAVLTNLWSSGLLPGAGYLGPMLSQGYVGHITLLPRGVGISDYMTILDNPTEERLLEQMIASQRSTWPSVALLHNSCEIEFTLDDCVSQLRRKVEEEAELASSSIAFLSQQPRVSNVNVNAAAAAAASAAVVASRILASETNAGGSGLTARGLRSSISSASLAAAALADANALTEGGRNAYYVPRTPGSIQTPFPPKAVNFGVRSPFASETFTNGIVRRNASSSALVSSPLIQQQRNVDSNLLQRQNEAEARAHQQARTGILTHHLVRVMGPVKARPFLHSLYRPEIATRIYIELFGGNPIQPDSQRKELKPTVAQMSGSSPTLGPVSYENKTDMTPHITLQRTTSDNSEASSDFSSSSAAAVAATILANTAAALGENYDHGQGHDPNLAQPGLESYHVEDKHDEVDIDQHAATPLEPLGDGRRLRYTRPPSQLVPSVARINDEAKCFTERRKRQKQENPSVHLACPAHIQDSSNNHLSSDPTSKLSTLQKLSRVQSFVADILPKGNILASNSSKLSLNARTPSAIARSTVNTQTINAVIAATGMDPSTAIVIDDGPNAPLFIMEHRLKAQGSFVSNYSSTSIPNDHIHFTALASAPALGLSDSESEASSDEEERPGSSRESVQVNETVYQPLYRPEEPKLSPNEETSRTSNAIQTSKRLAEVLASDPLFSAGNLAPSNQHQNQPLVSAPSPMSSLQLQTTRSFDKFRRISDTQLREHLSKFQSRNTLCDEEAKAYVNPIVTNSPLLMARTGSGIINNSRQGITDSTDEQLELATSLDRQFTPRVEKRLDIRRENNSPSVSFRQLVPPPMIASEQKTAMSLLSTPRMSTERVGDLSKPPSSLHLQEEMDSSASAAGVGTYSSGKLKAARRSMMVIQNLIEEDIHCPVDVDIESERIAAAAVQAANAAAHAAAVAAAADADFEGEPIEAYEQEEEDMEDHQSWSISLNDSSMQNGTLMDKTHQDTSQKS